MPLSGCVRIACDCLQFFLIYEFRSFFGFSSSSRFVFLFSSRRCSFPCTATATLHHRRVYRRKMELWIKLLVEHCQQLHNCNKQNGHASASSFILLRSVSAYAFLPPLGCRCECVCVCMCLWVCVLPFYCCAHLDVFNYIQSSSSLFR